MKKLILFAVLAFLAGSVQAQQTIVKAPASVEPGILNQNEAPVVTIDQQFGPLVEPATVNRVKSNENTLRKTKFNDLFEIGLMANTYAMIGESRTQIACDPKTNNVAVIFRGNDRSSSGDGNTLYIRYSSDQGVSWGDKGDNIATSPSPRYPIVFLPNTGSGVNTSVLWPQVVQFGDGSEGFGDVYNMKSDIGNGNPSYGKLSTPPNWSIPSSIIMDQSSGDLYSIAMVVEPSNGQGTGEYYVIRSQDKGATWAAVNFDNPAFTGDLVPQGYFASNLRLDISPDGSTMIAAFALIQEQATNPGSALLLSEGHEVAWRVSNDKGATWGDLQRIRPDDITNKPAPFDAKFTMAWDFDLVIDYKNRPHFLTVCSADLNPFTPFDEAPTDSTISLRHVDSTFTTEITIDDQDTWHIYPIGPVLRVRTDRGSFTASSSDDSPYVFRNEPKWARSYDGKKIYAKWISPLRTWTIANVAGQPTLFADTIHQIYVNGRLVDNPVDKPGWTYAWDFANPMNNTNAMDSVMRVTDLEEVDAKFTKLAYYAGEEGQLHIIFVEWGIGETLDDDPLFTDQVVWYVEGVQVPTMPAAVEQVDATPGNFALAQNYPNPFNPSTDISFTLPKAAQVSLRVYNLLGQEVATLVNEYRSAGTHRATFDAQNLPSGMYIYRLESGSQSISRKMMLSK